MANLAPTLDQLDPSAAPQMTPDQIWNLRQAGTYSPDELRQLEKSETTEAQLQQKVHELKFQAEQALTEFRSLEENPVIDRTFEFKLKINSETSPERISQIIEQIKIQNEQKKAAKQAKENVSQDPVVNDIYHRITEQISSEEAKKYLGEKQVADFLNWYKSQFTPQTTADQARELFKQMSEGPDGIKPRMELFKNELEPKLKAYSVELKDTTLLKLEGRSERRRTLELVAEAENVLEANVKDDLIIGAVKRNYIQKMLKASSLKDVEKMKDTALETTKLDREIHGQKMLEKKVFVSNREINLISLDERQTISQFHKNENDLEQKQTYLKYIPDMIQKAEKQFRELEKIFNKHPEGINEALEEFAQTGYHKRQDLLNKYKQNVLEKTGQLEKEIKNLEEQGKSAIEKARSSNIISAKTYQSFIEYNNPKNFIDLTTGKISILKYQDYVIRLTSQTPDFDAKTRNLKAYELHREKFIETLDRYRHKNPELNSSKYAEKINAYNDQTNSGRKNLYLQLKEEISQFERAEIQKQQNTLIIGQTIDLAIKESKKEDIWEDIYSALGKTKIPNEEITTYIKRNYSIIEHKIAAQQQENMKPTKRIAENFEKSLKYNDDDLENTHFHQDYNAFKKEILARLKDKSYLQLEETFIEEKTKELYENYLEEVKDLEKPEVQEIKKEQKETKEEIIEVIDEEPERDEEPIEEEIELAEVKEPEPEIKAEIVEEPEPETIEEPEVEIIEEPEIKEIPEEEEVETEPEETEEEASEYKLNPNFKNILSEIRFRQLQKLYSPEELEESEAIFNQYFNSNPHFHSLMQQNAKTELPIFLFLTLNKLQPSGLQAFGTLLSDKKSTVEDLAALVMEKLEKNVAPNIFSGRLPDTFKVVTKTLEEREANKIEPEVDVVAEDVVEEVEPPPEEVILFKEPEIIEPEIEAETPEIPAPEIIEESEPIELEKPENPAPEIIEEPEIIETIEEPIEEEPEPETESEPVIEEPIELETEEIPAPEIIEEPEIIEAEIETEPEEEIEIETIEPPIELPEEFRETETPIEEEIEKAIKIEELLETDLENIPPEELEKIILQKLTPEKIKETLEELTALLQNPDEKSAFILLQFLKIIYRLPKDFDLAELLESFSTFVANFAGKKIPFEIIGEAEIQVMKAQNQQEILSALTANLPKELGTIQSLTYILSEKSFYFNTMVANIKFEVQTENETLNKDIEARLVDKE